MVLGSIGYTRKPSAAGAKNGVVVGAARFPLNMSTFRSQHGSLEAPRDDNATYENVLVPVECDIEDGRACERPRRLATDGFELTRSPSPFLDIESHLRNVEAAAISLTRASVAVAYCYAARAPKRPGLGDETTRASYATYAHTDQAHLSWSSRLPELIQKENLQGNGGGWPTGIDASVAKRAVEGKRYAILSAWRYLGPETKCRSSHLAILDPSSLSPSDVLHFDILAKGTAGSNYRLDHTSSKHHKWIFFDEMDRDELLFFTVFDTNPTFSNAKATAAPTVFHSAFHDGRHPDAPDRESIDVRLLLVWD